MMYRVTITALFGLAALMTHVDAGAQDPSPMPTANRRAPDVRDTLLLLDTGPLHLRLQVMLNGSRLQDARDASIEQMIKSLDANGDGKVSRWEARKSPLFSSTRPVEGNKFLEALDGDHEISRREFTQAVERVGGEAITYRQDLTSEQQDLEFFNRLDQDGSGVLEVEELNSAAALLARLDADEDQCIRFDEVVPPRSPPDPRNRDVADRNVPVNGTQTERPTPGVAQMLRDLREPMLAHRVVKLYDRNRDGALNEAELGWSSQRFMMLDRNNDQKLDERELSHIAETTPDVEIAVDLAPANEQQPMIQVLSVTGQRTDDGTRRDFARVRFSSVVISISCRQIDSLRKSLENAQEQFNLLDQDGNGYIDASEAKERLRFHRNLFESIDLDGDGRIYGEELEKFVAIRGEPSATSCRVNLYDTGHGFFQHLDRNADGSISQRELKLVGQSLLNLQKFPGAAVRRTDPIRSFHLHFARGVFQLFTAVEQSSGNPAVQQLAPHGPIWFQKMDRNNDGDLVWSEFFGPRTVFDAIDQDRDGFIDVEEAISAESRLALKP